MSVDVSRAFYSRLRTDTGGGTNAVRTSVGDRIYALEAPASSALPLLVFPKSETSTVAWT